MASTRKDRGTTTAPARRRRLPAHERRADMVRRAGEHFAAHGFDSSTRDVAAALGVTQALIYRHFRSKDDLIEKTLEAVLGDASRAGPWLDTAAPPEEEFGRFYRSFVARSTEARMRLFIRAGLDGRSWPARRGNALTRNLFVPAIAALRANAGLPGLETVPAMRGERELVMMLHASMVFLGIRRHVYAMPMPENLDDVVDLYVRTFLSGALPAIRELHESGQDSLQVTLLAQAPAPAARTVSAPDRRRTSST